MASLIVNLGLLRIGQQTFRSTNYNVNRHGQTMSFDDSATAFIAGATGLGSPTNEFDAAFDTTPTESGQTIIMTTTVPTGSGNFPIRRIAEHSDTAANVTGSSTTLIGGVDNQLLQKTVDFALAATKNYTFTSI